MTDAELRALLNRLCDGDRAAFEALYHGLKTPVFTILLRITRDRALSEDILQEFFLKLFQSPPGPEIRKPRAYLFQSARNLALDALRRQSDHAGLEEAEDIPASEENHDDRLDLDAAFAALTVEQRQLVTLHLNAGLKFREIAAITGKPLGTVLWQYRRAISRMRNYLNGGI